MIILQLLNLFLVISNTVQKTNSNGFKLLEGVFDDIITNANKKIEDDESEGAGVRPVPKGIKPGLNIMEWNKLSRSEMMELIESEQERRTYLNDGRIPAYKTTAPPRTGTISPAEAEYKRNMRYKKWSQKWRGFNPETEGISIDERLVKVGFQNASNFIDLNAF